MASFTSRDGDKPEPEPEEQPEGTNTQGSSGEDSPFFTMEASEKVNVCLASGTSVQQVLIVEDDYDNAELLQALLTHNEIESNVVHCADEAMRFCQEYTPLLVLMDIGLPDSNGLVLTHMLKQMPRMANVPFVAVSAHASERMRDLAGEAGCDDFMAKPWSSGDIVAIVRKYCE